jgi:hypothetical protein
VAIPVWIAGGNKLPAIAAIKEDLHSPICDAALVMKKECFPLTSDGRQNYINLSAVINLNNTGYMQLLNPLEKEIFAKADQLIKGLDKGKKSATDIQDYYKWLDSYLDENYRKMFNIQLL